MFNDLASSNHVLIVGGSSGLGLALAKRLLREHWMRNVAGQGYFVQERERLYVTIVGRDRNKLLRATRDLIEMAKRDNVHVVNEKEDAEENFRWPYLLSRNTSLLRVVCDATDMEQCRRAVKDAIQWHKYVDWVVCCAGCAKPGLFMQTETSVFLEQFQENCMTTVNPIRAVLDTQLSMLSEQESKKHAKEPSAILGGLLGGRIDLSRIVIVSSAAGLVGVPGYSHYSGSKFALRGIADTLRIEMKPYGVSTHLFHASSMDTPGYEQENLSKPEVTRIIEEGEVKLWKPEEAAEHLLSGIRKGHYHITSDSNVDLLRMTMNGATPRNRSWLETLLLPFVPLVEWYYRSRVLERLYQQHVPKSVYEPNYPTPVLRRF